ncbi:hypothetical protein PtB15_4B564 [Puccinia triticina]|nr:hypothetical protein PtB15_4B564 [Puccinia triticina]
MAAPRRTLPLASLTTPCTALLNNWPGPLPAAILARSNSRNLANGSVAPLAAAEASSALIFRIASSLRISIILHVVFLLYSSLSIQMA